MMFEGAAVRVVCAFNFGAGMLVSGCVWKVLLEGAVELASLLVLLQGVMLQGAARRVRTVPNSCCKGAM